jgi:hypothetical protein
MQEVKRVPFCSAVQSSLDDSNDGEQLRVYALLSWVWLVRLQPKQLWR